MNLSFRNQSHIHLNCKAEPVTNCGQQHSVANNKYHRYFKNSNKSTLLFI